MKKEENLRKKSNIVEIFGKIKFCNEEFSSIYTSFWLFVRWFMQLWTSVDFSQKYFIENYLNSSNWWVIYPVLQPTPSYNYTIVHIQNILSLATFFIFFDANLSLKRRSSQH